MGERKDQCIYKTPENNYQKGSDKSLPTNNFNVNGLNFSIRRQRG
jgi:hypothetical protein